MSIAMTQMKQKILSYVKSSGGIVPFANAVESGRLSDYSRMVSAYDAIGELQKDGVITFNDKLIALCV